MCMNIFPNVLETLKLLRFIGIDAFFFNQIALYHHGVTQGGNSEIQNAAVFLKRKTSWNWILKKRLISRSSSTSYW